MLLQENPNRLLELWDIYEKLFCQKFKFLLIEKIIGYLFTKKFRRPKTLNSFSFPLFSVDVHTTRSVYTDVSGTARTTRRTGMKLPHELNSSRQRFGGFKWKAKSM